MPIQNLSLAAIINESQQGEQAARRAIPSSHQLPQLELSLPKPKDPEKKVPKVAGQEAVIQDQEGVDKDLEIKKRAMEEASKAQTSTTALIQMPQQVAYLDTFLKIFGVG